MPLLLKLGTKGKCNQLYICLLPQSFYLINRGCQPTLKIRQGWDRILILTCQAVRNNTRTPFLFWIVLAVIMIHDRYVGRSFPTTRGATGSRPDQISAAQPSHVIFESSRWSEGAPTYGRLVYLAPESQGLFPTTVSPPTDKIPVVAQIFRQRFAQIISRRQKFQTFLGS